MIDKWIILYCSIDYGIQAAYDLLKKVGPVGFTGNWNYCKLCMETAAEEQGIELVK